MSRKSIGKEVITVSRQIIKLRNRCLEDFECEVSAAHVYAFLYFAHNSGCTEKQVALAIEKDKTNIAKSVKKLIQQGLIISKTCANDARCKHIWLTQKGEAEMQRVRKALKKISVVMSEGIEQTQIETFLEILEKMQNNILSSIESR